MSMPLLHKADLGPDITVWLMLLHPGSCYNNNLLLVSAKMVS